MLDLMRRYVYGFVNSHDSEVARLIMTKDYRLHMGSDTLYGRDGAYIPAVSHQLTQFPELTLSLHELVTDGTMTALLFSEHGWSASHPGKAACWRGVSIYRAESGRLAECWVEQDHFGRRAQLVNGVADPVAPVAIDPWSGHEPLSSPLEPTARAALERWADELSHWPPHAVRTDSGRSSAEQPKLEIAHVMINAMVAEGDRIAFNATIAGRYLGGLTGMDHQTDFGVETYVGAFATVRQGELHAVDAISNRVAVQRQLRNATPVEGPA